MKSVFLGDQISIGMWQEMKAAEELGIPVVQEGNK